MITRFTARRSLANHLWLDNLAVNGLIVDPK